MKLPTVSVESHLQSKKPFSLRLTQGVTNAHCIGEKGERVKAGMTEQNSGKTRSPKVSSRDVRSHHIISKLLPEKNIISLFSSSPSFPFIFVIFVVHT